MTQPTGPRPAVHSRLQAFSFTRWQLLFRCRDAEGGSRGSAAIRVIHSLFCPTRSNFALHA